MSNWRRVVFALIGVAAFFIGRAVLVGAAPQGVDREAAELAQMEIGKEREISPGQYMTLFRSQATEPIGGGSNLAVSTHGGFSVEVPLPFNDFEMRSAAADGVEIRTFGVGGKSPGLLSYAAMCLARADGSMLVAPSDVTESDGGLIPKGWKRQVVLDDRVCVLVVEAQGPDPLPSRSAIDQFLASLTITGPTEWPAAGAAPR